MQSNPPKPYRSKPIRFFILFLVTMVVFGSQYSFNNPQALETQIQHDLQIGETQFQLLYTICAFPNIFSTFFIGLLIDFLGVRIGIISLAAGITIFQLVIAFGGYYYSYSTILVGRMLFGLAGESLLTAQATMVSFWFRGKQLAFALGIAMTFPELGNALNSFLTPLIYQSSGSLGTSFLVSVFICMFGLVCALTAAYIDKKADQEDEINKVSVKESVTDINGEVQTQSIKWQDLKQLKLSFWLIVAICMFAIGLYVPFMDGANKLYQQRFCFGPVSAGKALVVTYVVAVVFSAPLGLLIDKVGHKRYFIIVSMCVFTFAQIFILVYPQCPNEGLAETGSIAGLAFIGLGFCFYANCIIPSVPLVVKKKITGTAFGIMQMLQSISLAFFPLINGSIIQHGSSSQIGYRHSSIFFVVIGFAGIILSCCLFFVPHKIKHKLDKVSKDKMHVQRGDNGAVVYTASESQTSQQQGKQQIEITSQKSDENLHASLLDESQSKQVALNL